MVLALTATITAVVCLLAGAVGATVSTRRLFASSPQAFRCKIGQVVGPSIGPDKASGGTATLRWPWLPSHAIWVHDSLIVVRGFFRTRIRPLAVHFAEGAVCGGHHRLTGVGADPVFLTLELDDGSQVVLAAPRSVKSLVVGPYLAALLSVGASRSTNGMGG